MLQRIPRSSERIFSTPNSVASNYYIQRKKLALKFNNPRILKVGLHTFRHWKATMEFHKTKNVGIVKKILGHRDIKSTDRYIDYEAALFNYSDNEFQVETAETLEEAVKLAEEGFDYWKEINGVHICRKRK